MDRDYTAIGSKSSKRRPQLHPNAIVNPVQFNVTGRRASNDRISFRDNDRLSLSQAAAINRSRNVDAERRVKLREYLDNTANESPPLYRLSTISTPIDVTRNVHAERGETLRVHLNNTANESPPLYRLSTTSTPIAVSRTHQPYPIPPVTHRHLIDRKSTHTPRKSHKREGSESGYGPQSWKRQPHSTMSSYNAQGSGLTPSSPIDLTGGDTNVYRPRIRTEQRRRSSNSIILPRWQPDSEVAKCPVCGANFNLWWRRHHCRKCGKVVCANCSQHRITIPRQFVVQPPPSANPTSLASLLGESSSSTPAQGSSPSGQDSPSGGAETVRVCNPCVPDPNLSPPPQLESDRTSSDYVSFPTPGHRRNSSQSGRPLPARYHPNPTRRTSDNNVQSPPSFHSRQSGSNASTHSLPRPNRSTAPFHSTSHHGHRASLQSPSIGASSVPHSNSGRTLVPPPHSPIHRHRHSTTSGATPQPFLQSGPHSSTPIVGSRPLQPPRPVRQIREEDECWICGRELPPKDPDGDEQARTQHVIGCLQQYSSPSASSGATSLPRSGPRPGSLPSGSGPTSTVGEAGEAAPTQRPRRVTGRGLLSYMASEKDCIGEEGEAQECVICFEEFEEGVQMARLECLCKFHYVCIKQWWRSQGLEMGACPTHQLHI